MDAHIFRVRMLFVGNQRKLDHGAARQAVELFRVAHFDGHDHPVHVIGDAVAGNGHGAMLLVHGEDQASCGVFLLRESRKSREQGREQNERGFAADCSRKCLKTPVHGVSLEEARGGRWEAAETAGGRWKSAGFRSKRFTSLLSSRISRNWFLATPVNL